MMKDYLFSFFRALFGIVFVIITTTVLFFDWMDYVCKKEFIIPNEVIFGLIVVFLLIGVYSYYWFKNRKGKLSTGFSKINVDKLVLTTTVILFLGQCYVFYNAFFLTGWDAEAIRWFVEIVTAESEKGWINMYYSRYPNNLAISYLFLFLSKINSHIGIFSGEYSYMWVVVLNCAINAFSCWLSYKTAKLFLSSYFSFAAYMLSVFSVGISGWSIIGYSDSLALFIPILSVYLYCKQYKRPAMKKWGFLMAGITSVLGYFIKPQCLFVLIAMMILEVKKMIDKRSLKGFLRPVILCLSAVIVFISTEAGLSSLNHKYDIRIDEEQSFGYAHFLMMGANEERNGVYLDTDVAFSGSFSTAEERNKANLEAFKDRIVEMKAGVIPHLTKKMLTTFNDGTFAWGVEGGFFRLVPQSINDKMAPFLKSFYHFGSRYTYLDAFQQIVWLFILLTSLLTVFWKKADRSRQNICLIWITLLGFVLYEMLFEVRARYLYIFVPLFCVLAAIGMKNATILAPKIYAWFRKTFRKDCKKL